MTRFFRPVAAALGVGVLTGLVVAGGGSRLAMRLIALADNREDFGFQTEAGAIVGDVTLGGTFFILLLGTMLGVLGAFLYLALRRWLPARPAYRTLVFALDPAVSLLSFAAVLLLYALVVPPLVDRIAPRTVDHSPWGRRIVASVVAVALVFGAVAVKYALELADGSRLPS